MSNDGNEISGSGQDAAGHQVLGTATDGREMRRWSCVNCVSLGPTTETGLRLLPLYDEYCNILEIDKLFSFL